MACPSRASRSTARCCRTSRSPSRWYSRRSPRRPRLRSRRKHVTLARGFQRPTRIALGDLRPAERGERAIHGAGLVLVLSVAGQHLSLIGPLLRCLEAAQEIAFALLFDGGDKVDVAAGAVFAGLEQLHGALASGRGVDRVDDFVEGHRFIETDPGERGTGAERKNHGYAGQDGSGDHRTPSLLKLGASSTERGSRTTDRQGHVTWLFA